MADISNHINAINNAVYGEEVRSSIVNAITAINDDNESYNTLKNEVVAAKDEIDEQAAAFNVVASAAEQTAIDLETKINTANTVKVALETATTEANTAKNNLESAISTANATKTNLTDATSTADTTKNNLETATSAANIAKTDLQTVINSANSIKASLDTTNTTAAMAKTSLETAISNADTVKTELSEVITNADTVKTNLDASVTTANSVLQSLTTENASASSNLEQLQSENFNSQEILSGVADLRAYLGLTDDDILGIQVDYKNKAYTRIAGATNLTAGTDFDRFSMFGGRKKCNVSDDGTIVAWYGDADYTEDGSMGQVMVYQPKFYYLVCPVVYDPIDTGVGYHLRKANYYVSEKARAGFRLHPAFYDAAGNEIDYFLTSAYEGNIWDADGGAEQTGAFLMNDEQVMDTTADKFCSVGGVKPASGLTQSLTRPDIETLAQNRGENWHGDLIKQVSAEQMLMIIEMGTMNLQTAITNGVVSIADNSAYNCSSLTGSTANLGNGTGQATSTVNKKGDTTTTETTNGKTAVCWRGKENFWGNIWKFVYGVNIWGNGNMGGGQPYICTDFSFAENKNSGNYEAAGFTVTNTSGYISAMGYSTSCDWLFMASECLGNSSLPVGDYTYIAENLSNYRIALLGGCWNSGGSAGAFCWVLNSGVGSRDRLIGGRLVYVPTRGSQVYLAAIASWEEKMAA